MLKYTSGAAFFKRDSDARHGFGGNSIQYPSEKLFISLTNVLIFHARGSIFLQTKDISRFFYLEMNGTESNT